MSQTERASILTSHSWFSLEVILSPGDTTEH